MTGNKFYLIRCEMGLTQEELAKKMGMHCTSIGKIEKRTKVKPLHEFAILWVQYIRNKRSVKNAKNQID